MNLPQVLSIFVLIASTVFQSPAAADVTKHFEKEGVAFDYPANWNLTETDADGAKTIILTPEPGTGRITIGLRDVLGCDFQAENKKIENALINNLSAEINAGQVPNTSPVATQVGKTDVQGTRLVSLKKSTVAGDVYSFRTNWRFVSLVYVRDAKDERASDAWDKIRTSLKVEPRVIAATAIDPAQNNNVPLASAPSSIKAGVLNGRALSLPQPSYPAIARAAHISGTVTVQIIIDESGAVSSAHAIDGHPLLQGTCVEAARHAQFTPTKLCGEPVKVTGVITYNFVAR
jgi:TonB family protein